MSDKEAAMQLIQRLPDDVSIEGILCCLKEGFRVEPVRPDSGEDASEWWTEEMTEDEWREFVAWGLRDELNDPREDIYTLEDGEPADDPR